MNPYINKYPVRLLVVEDQEVDRIECVDRLRRKFPNAHIEEAGSRDEAFGRVLEAHSHNLPYDCAVLDLKIPNSLGEIPSPNTSIARLIIDKFGRTATRLVQWTAYPEDQAIRQFQDDNKIPQSGIVYEVISKREMEWPVKLEQFIYRLIAEKTVGRWLDDPYFQRMRQRSASIASKRPEFDCPPVSLPGFLSVLMEVWTLLENYRKSEALDTFHGSDWEITEEGGQVRFRHERVAQAMQDARENAKIFEDIMLRRDEKP